MEATITNPANGSIIDLPLDLIKNDRGTEVRTPDPVVYMEYRERILAGDVFPEIDLFWDGDVFIMADGRHRFYGHREAGRKSIRAKIHYGPADDALWFAAGCNQKHGKRRTNADKRDAVTALLLNKKFVKLSDRNLADHAAVDHKTVASVRAELVAAGEIPQLKEREGRDGKSRPATMPAAARTATLDIESRASAYFNSVVPEYEAGGHEDPAEFKAAVATITDKLGDDAKVRILSGGSGLSQEEVAAVANLPAAELADELGITRPFAAEDVLQNCIDKRREFYGDLADVRPNRMAAKIKAEMTPCRRGGDHQWVWDGNDPTDEYCAKCKHPRDAAPVAKEPAKISCPKCGATDLITPDKGRFSTALCMNCDAGDSTPLIVDTKPEQPDEHLSDLLITAGNTLRTLVAKFPAKYREALGNRLVSAGEELIEHGEIR